MPIQVLPPQLANQIAAGEVVERPASVIKELVENCIDAGADRIDIHVEQGGSKLIRIRDNGCGIAKDELALALARHATSKISSLDDLSAIVSLGFRGEALASISSVSRLTLTSRTKDQNEAWQVYAEGRDMQAVVKPAAHPVGTTVEVLDLFYNTPARRRFLRTEKTEFGHVDEVIRRIALARPDISINLFHNDKPIRQYRAATSTEQVERRIAAVGGLAFIQNAIKLEWEHDDLNIRGWIAETNNAELQYFYVNGRIVKDRLLNHAIKQAYQNQPQSENFAYVIYLDVDPHQVDVNVHPAKHEVRFHEARLVHDFVHQAIVMALDAKSQTQQDFISAQPRTVNEVAPNRQAAGGNIFDLAKQSKPYSQPPASTKKNEARESLIYQTLVDTHRDTGQSKPYVERVKEPAAVNNVHEALFPERRSPLVLPTVEVTPAKSTTEQLKFGQVLALYQTDYALLASAGELQLLSLPLAQKQLYSGKLLAQVKQPAEVLLIPLMLLLNKNEITLLTQNQAVLTQFNLQLSVDKMKVHLNAVPLLLRNMNWQQLLPDMLSYLATLKAQQVDLTFELLAHWFADRFFQFSQINKSDWTMAQVVNLLSELEQLPIDDKQCQALLRVIDLSGVIKQFAG
ncbi:DNA mismatch repair endonuclease MutL [Zophobihabitans entericus]|uniref:DNA mismatch repair protein MutL n=1 Tax=Zophobihabitans entericus TaxID=1635327 RepID=A0A6G9IAA2_9GAMM|nr:DNA mismatch repair endonuclease MutL [Zophobihabitans entericus]QIQ20510.1 DNA mismatch repair endonuclease MutL [Zophobihabitans entericus]